MEQILIILVWSLIWGIASAVLGRTKGINGFWYGFFLGLIGFIIVICMKERKEENVSRIIVQNSRGTSEDKFKTLEKLYELKSNGVITEEEFNIEKSKIMAD